MKTARIALIIASAVLLASAIYKMNGTVAVPPHVVNSFTAWTAQYNKKYSSPSEKIYRLAVFYKNYKMVTEHNRSNDTFTMALNHFADMTQEEFKTKMLGYRFENRPRNYNAPTLRQTPPAVDWRDKGIVNAIKDQGQCGSCWAFSAIQAVESGWKQAKGTLLSLSEQQLVDCSTSYGNHGCNGGLMDYAFKYIKAHGITTESAYPYKARDGRCRSGVTQAAKINGYTDVQQNGQQVENANAQHVLSIAVDAQRWSFYHHGVYSHRQCGTQLDHGVGLVGYGSASGQDFWIVRNSWGTRWGESGYIRLEKQISSR